MPFTATYDWNEIVSSAFDLLVDQPEGATLEQIQDRIGCEAHVARLAISRLRETLGDDSNANVLVKAEGRSRLYVLAGEGSHSLLEDDGAWLSFNQKYVETRLSTVRKVYASMARAVRDEAQADACRRLVKNLDRLIEDIAEVHAP